MKKRIIRCSGVPEHFNYPWRQVIDNKLFNSKRVDLSWSDDPSGTGSLCKRLANDEVDIAMLLLEGAIKNYRSANFTLFSIYVDTPLNWGVHSGGSSTLSADSLNNPSFAISRYTSGSHLMAYVYANSKGMNLEKLAFEEVGDIKGAMKSLGINDNQLFLWERFTTNPYVQKGLVNCIDYCSTPWPAFVIAVNNNLLKQEYQEVEAIVKTVQEQAQKIKATEASIEQIAAFYQLSKKDVGLWMKDIEWSDSIEVDQSTVLDASKILLELNIIEELPDFDQLLISQKKEETYLKGER